MKRRLVLMCAAIFCCSLATTGAQQPAAVFDPPDAQYQSGLDDIDPAVEKTLPVAPRYRDFLPPAVNLSSRLPAPGQQGRANSCTAWAVAYAARSYYASTRENRDTQKPENLPSPNYVYTMARQRSNMPVCHKGSNLEATVEVLKRGALSLAQHPYQADDCEAPPPPDVVQTAGDFKVRGMLLLNVKRIDDVKGQLAQSNPVIIEFHSSSSFKQHHGDTVYADAKPEYDSSDVWHAMTLVGYDEKRQAFRLINSWGRGWGDRGYAWISYDVFARRVRRAAILDVDVPPPPVAQRLEKIESARLTPAPAPPGPIPGPIEDVNRPPIVSKPAEPTPSPAPQRPGPKALPKPELPQPVAPPVRLKAELADLQRLACARVTVTKRGERNVLRAFVGSEAEVELVTRIAADVPKTGLGEITVAPWPQCEALQTLDMALAAADRPKINIGARDELREGERLQIDIRSPRRIGYLYVTYVQSDGSGQHSRSLLHSDEK